MSEQTPLWLQVASAMGPTVALVTGMVTLVVQNRSSDRRAREDRSAQSDRAQDDRHASEIARTRAAQEQAYLSFIKESGAVRRALEESFRRRPAESDLLPLLDKLRSSVAEVELRGAVTAFALANITWMNMHVACLAALNGDKTSVATLYNEATSSYHSAVQWMRHDIGLGPEPVMP